MIMIGSMITILTNTYAQDDNPVLSLQIPAQNLNKYNRFFKNPTYSFVREDNQHISLFHRSQWIEFNDSPKIYMGSYSGRLNEKSGFGFGIYQQNLGVINSFGGFANYAYNIKLWRDLNMTLGFNFAYISSGVAKDKTITSESDPLILSLQNNSLLSIKPGLTLSYKNIDLSFYARDLVDYNFKGEENTEEYINKTYQGEISYTQPMTSSNKLFKDSFFRVSLGGEMNEIQGFGIEGSVIVDFPTMGWIQTGIDDYYGISAGVGVHLSRQLSLGYNYEKTTKEGLVNLGSTHELSITYSLKPRKNKIITETEPLANKAEIEASKQRDDANNRTNNARKKLLDKLTEIREESKNEQNNAEEQSTQNNTLNGTISLEIKHIFDDNNNRISTDVSTNTRESNSTSQTGNNAIENEILERLLRLTKELDAKNDYLLEMLLAQDSIFNLNKEKLDLQIENLIAYAERAQSSPSNNIVKPSIRKKPRIKKSTSSRNTTKEEKVDSKESSVSSKEKTNTTKNTTKRRRTPKREPKMIIKGVPSGFYLVANVFSQKENTNKFLKKLKEKGIEAEYFVNPKNNYMYVYLGRFDTWKEALDGYYYNINNTYFDEIWIKTVSSN